MAKVTAALVREQGVNFAVVLIRRTALQQSMSARADLVAGLSTIFRDNHVILCALDPAGRPEYWGRRDIVRFLSNISFEKLPWAQYNAA